MDIETFAARYSEGDNEQLRFKWNGKHGDLFCDENKAFRQLVLAHALNHLSEVPGILLRDLFTAETECSKQEWCISREAHLLAVGMMTRCRTRFLKEYLIGNMQSFDSHLGTSLLGVDPRILNECLDEIDRTLSRDMDAASNDLYWQGKKMFEEWLAKGNLPGRG